MKNKTITIDQIMSLQPCWGNARERLQELFGELKEASALDILTCDKVEGTAKVWLIGREHFMTKEDMVEFANWCAAEAVRIVANAASYAAANASYAAANAARAAEIARAAEFAEVAEVASYAAANAAAPNAAAREKQIEYLISRIEKENANEN